MNAQDLSDAINLGILVLAIYGVCWCANMCCPPDAKAAAWDDAEQALAAGYGEGYATAERIGQHYRNVMALHFHHHHNASHKHAHQKIIVFLEQNLQCVALSSIYFCSAL
jgi:hypothetical protein